jgi:hypothetical protein
VRELSWTAAAAWRKEGSASSGGATIDQRVVRRAAGVAAEAADNAVPAATVAPMAIFSPGLTLAVVGA